MLDSEQLTAKVKLVTARAVGDKTVVADAVEAVGQAVQEKAAEELLGVKRHHFGFTVVPMVLPRGADFAVG
jgi:hypothetical protein